MSTAEAELGATVKGAAEGEGVLSLLSDFHITARLVLKSDASAAIGITKRIGLGKVRHLATGDLWIQQKVRKGELEVSKLPGKENPADAFTKPLDGLRIKDLMQRIGVRVPLGASGVGGVGCGHGCGTFVGEPCHHPTACSSVVGVPSTYRCGV